MNAIKIKNFRSWIGGLLAISTALSYLDRQTLAVVISELNKFIPTNSSQYGLINSVFLFAYGTMYAVGGRLIDILGTKTGMAIMVSGIYCSRNITPRKFSSYPFDYQKNRACKY